MYNDILKTALHVLLLSGSFACGFADVYAEFDKTDAAFFHGIEDMVRNTLEGTHPSPAVPVSSENSDTTHEPLVIVKRDSGGKYLYYFFLRECGNTCVAVAFIPKEGDTCWLKIALDTAAKELVPLEHIQWNIGAYNGETTLSPLLIWM